MFTQSCIINICSEDIKNKLKNIGYLYNSNGAAYGNNSIIYTNGDNFYLKKDYKSLVRDRSKQYIKKTIDCGTNKDLFLAISELRDDTDENQWFVSNDNAEWYRHYSYFDGDPNKDNAYSVIRKDKWHKATVQELVEHFNSK